jgi:5-formyltetrahydrofolate cyclo-ligase
MHSHLIRQQIKNQRRQLSRSILKQHRTQLYRQALNYKPFRGSQRIAFYYAVAGEMDPSLLLEAAIKSGKKAYLPILRQPTYNSLWFAPFTLGNKLRLNRFTIPEPEFKHHQLIMPWSLDTVFVPLVAFDRQGHRLGMGGGYYDRTFSFKKQRIHLTGPKLIGLAHEFQLYPHLESHPWDIPLDAVITESSIYTFTHHNHRQITVS